MNVELGTEKCLVILGVPGECISEKIQKSNGNLQHKDVEVLGIEIMTSTKGELVESVLEKKELNYFSQSQHPSTPAFKLISS